VTEATSLTATCYNGNFAISGVCLPIGELEGHMCVRDVHSVIAQGVTAMHSAATLLPTPSVMKCIIASV
jgi:hypothetical protein